uniref:LAMP family protein lmp-1 (inferred by orthology to a C. elegans protein) n=1 Tax=Strongyloides venezuelensis TaxID=75913 RepID=A0A0K0FYU9_STRVS
MKEFFLLLALAVVISADVYTAKTKEGTYCIILEANITGSITYNKKGSTTSLETFNFVVPHTATSSGDCASTNGTQVLNIDFLPEANITGTWHISLSFDTKSDFEKDKSFRLISYSLHADLSDDAIFNSTEKSKKYKSPGKFSDWDVAGKNTAYTCSTNKLEFDEGAKLIFDNLKVIAEEELNKPYFENGTIYNVCFEDSKTSDVVPIVVGACLTGLVIVVLVAYLIGRQRAKRQGYASV